MQHYTSKPPGSFGCGPSCAPIAYVVVICRRVSSCWRGCQVADRAGRARPSGAGGTWQNSIAGCDHG